MDRTSFTQPSLVDMELWDVPLNDEESSSERGEPSLWSPEHACGMSLPTMVAARPGEESALQERVAACAVQILADDIPDGESLSELLNCDLAEFVERFNGRPDHREFYQKVWRTRYCKLMNQGRDTETGQFIPERVAVTRDGLAQLWLTKDPVLVKQAVESLVIILEGTNHYPCAAHNLVGLAKTMWRLLSAERVEELTTDVQRMAVRAYALTVQSVLLHYSVGHLNAVRQETKDQIWEQTDAIGDLNKLEDAEINFWVFYALEAAKRLKSNQGKFEGILQRLKGLAIAGLAVADVIVNRSEFVANFEYALQGLSQTFYHLGGKDSSFDTLLVFKKLLHLAANDVELFRRVKRMVQNNKAAQASADEQVLYGTVEFLSYTAMSTPNREIREESLKLIVQYASVANPVIHTKVIEVLAQMMSDCMDPELQFTAKMLLDILSASGTIESDQGKCRLLVADTIGRALLERHGDEPAAIYENVVKFALRRMAEIKEEGYPGISLLNQLAPSEHGNLDKLVLAIGLQPGVDHLAPDAQGNTPFHLAVREGNLTMLQALKTIADREENSDAVNEPDALGRKALHLAAANGDTTLAQMLLDMGCVPCLLDSEGRTPLGEAIRHEQLEVADLLIRNGATAPEHNSGVSALLYAARWRKEKVVIHLLNQADDITPMEAYTINRMMFRQGALACSQEFAQFHMRRRDSDEQYRKLSDMFGWQLRVCSQHSDRLEAFQPEIQYPPLINAIREGNFDAAQAMLINGTDVQVVHQMRDNIGNAPLHYAVENEGELACRMVKMLIGSGAAIDAGNRFGLTPLHRAVSLGRRDLVELLMAAQADVNAREIAGFTPLHLAAAYRDEKMVRLLLEHGADPDAVSASGLTPLHMGAGTPLPANSPSFALLNHPTRVEGEHPEVEVIDALIEGGASLDIEDENGNSILHLAAQYGRHHLVTLLLDRDSDMYWIPNQFGRYPLYYAFYSRSPETVAAMFGQNRDVRILADQYFARTWQRETLANLAAVTGQSEALRVILEAHPALIHSRDLRHRGRTPLQLGASEGYDDVVSVCLELGADANRANDYKRTALHQAVMVGKQGIIRQLLAAGADAMAKDQSGSTPLHEAGLRNQPDISAILVAAGGDGSGLDANGNTPLHMAARSGSMDMIRYLVEELGVDIHATNDDGKTALHAASGQAQADAVAYLLAAGANPNVEDFYGATPLHMAAQVGSTEIAERLLAQGAYLLAKDDDEETALHKAVFTGKIQMVKLLLHHDSLRAHPIIVHARDNYGEPPLHEIVKRGSAYSSLDVETKKIIALLLLDAGADMRAVEENGQTLLHMLAAEGEVLLVQFLVRHCRNNRIPLDVSAVDNKGNTPLHYACKRGHRMLAAYLIAKGASRNAGNNDGDSPLLFAARNGHQAVIEILQQFRVSATTRNGKKQNALHVAIENHPGDTQLFETILAADRWLVAGTDENGNTPLHYAAQMDDFATADFLLRFINFMSDKKRLAYMDQKNNFGQMPLDLALDLGHERFAQRLDSFPKSALDVEEGHGQVEREQCRNIRYHNRIKHTV